MNPELPTSAMGTLRLMPTTASQIGQFSKQLIQGVQEGNINPLELLVVLRALGGVSKTVLDCINENIQTAADKYNEKEFEVFGAKIQKGDVGVEYDYKSSGDRDWERFATDEATAAARRKERETFLRSLKEPMSVLDEDSGETWQIRPPLRRSKSGVKVFLK